MANVYWSTSRIKIRFLPVLADLPSTTGLLAGNRFLLFDDYNCPGVNSSCIDGDLESVFSMYSMKQQPTRRDQNGRENILDLIVTTSTSGLVSNVSVEPSRKRNITTRRIKLHPIQYTFRDLENVDIVRDRSKKFGLTLQNLNQSILCCFLLTRVC